MLLLCCCCCCYCCSPVAATRCSMTRILILIIIYDCHYPGFTAPDGAALAGEGPWVMDWQEVNLRHHHHPHQSSLTSTATANAQATCRVGACQSTSHDRPKASFRSCKIPCMGAEGWGGTAHSCPMPASIVSNQWQLHHEQSKGQGSPHSTRFHLLSTPAEALHRVVF